MPNLFGLAIFCCFLGIGVCGPLDDYVWKDDGHYKYEQLRDQTYRSPGVTTYVLNMTSQKWLNESEVSRSIWWHYVIINIPDEIDEQLKNSAYLLVDGDNNSDQPPEQTDPFIEAFRLVAAATKSVTAVLKNIPNCRIKFASDPEHRDLSENAILAYSWKAFIDEPTRPEWLVTLPMTKAGVKAMDTVTDFVKAKIGADVQNYCVAGASKRGWAAWTTAAVDSKRVKCLTPVVYDYLNFVENFHHHYRAYGGWSFALSDFYRYNITKNLDSTATNMMASITDPFAYRDRLTMPKMVVSSTGDEYFLPDDSHYYFTHMEGPTYVNMLPNAEHTCVGHEMQLFFNLATFYMGVMKGQKLPKVSWTLEKTALGGRIAVTMDTKPMLIRAWHTTTPNVTRRDFRLLIADPSHPTSSVPRPIIWDHSDVTKEDELSYSFEMNKPLKGWRAFFIQMTFPQADGRSFECTTETNVIPTTFPFPECYQEGCYGELV